MTHAGSKSVDSADINDRDASIDSGLRYFYPFGGGAACRMASITAALMLIVVVQDWARASAARLAVPTMPGSPRGLLLLRSVAEPVVKRELAAPIFTFSGHLLVGGAR